MKKLYSIFFFLIGIVCLVGCGQKANPLKGKNTDERILMCLEKEYPEHDFETVESFNRETDSGIFKDEEGREFAVHGLVYDNTYHFGCRNDYLKILLEQQDYLSKINTIAEEYGFNVDYSEETIGIDGNKNENESDTDSIDRISKMLQRILNSVDTPQIVYPKAAGSFSTGEINYYSVPCWGQLTCIYHIEGHSAIITVRFGEENLTEDAISTIVREALEQTNKNIEEENMPYGV